MALSARASYPLVSLALTPTAVAPPDTRTVGLSLLLHLGVLLLAFVASWKSASERPLGAAVQVSLITLPPAPKLVEVKSQAKPSPPQKTEPVPAPPQPKVEIPKPVTLPQPPAPVVAKAPAAAPVQAPAPVERALPPPPVVQPPKIASPAPSALPPMPSAAAPEKRALTENPLRGALKNLELPHDAPKFGELSPDKAFGQAPQPIAKVKPQPVPDRTKQDVQSLLSKLRVPEAQQPVQPVPPVELPTRREERRRLDEDYQQELEKELQRVRQSAPAPAQPREFNTAEVKTASSRPDPAPPAEAKPVQHAKASPAKPEMALKVPGMGAGSNAYLGMVQRRISEYWQAPPVDLSAESLVVVVRFRLSRNGTVTAVVVEQSSGNDYYDLAAKRAVLNADPLPPFPKELTDPYYDAHFSFVVGGQTG